MELSVAAGMTMRRTPVSPRGVEVMVHGPSIARQASI